MIIIVILNYRNRDFKSLRGRERNNEVRNKISMINLTDYKASLTATSDRIIASNFSPLKKRAHTLPSPPPGYLLPTLEKHGKYFTETRKSTYA